ncbi:MAG TPA: bacillithiol biosynthesis BshC, partial [Longimicrobiales bacterium]
MSTAAPDRIAGLNIDLHVENLSAPQLVVDYYDAATALAPFYAGSPFDTGSYEHLTRAVRHCFDNAARRAMIDAVEGTTERARAKLESIAAGDGFFVATGQQAGLFGGPLYTLYKTLTTIRLAEALEEQLGVTVAPLFWIAADDHDFAEVNHAYVMGSDNELHRLEIDGNVESARSMNRHLLDESAGRAVDELTRLLPANEFSVDLLAAVRAAYVPGQSVAGAFQQLIRHIFARH